MNILYIGPYRLNNSIGYESLNILLDLQDNFPNLMARPIYGQYPIHKLEDLTSVLDNLENKAFRNFDVIIQHTTIESTVFNTKAQKQIFIPILSNHLCSYTQAQIVKTLQNHGLFVTHKNTEDFILMDAGVTNKQSFKPNISNRLSMSSRNSFDFGLYNSYQKYYTISGSQNEENIRDLIINFIVNINSINSCLVLFLHDINQSVLDKYNAFIKNVYHTMNINHSISKVIIIPIELNNKVISTIHTCGDIYIDINNDIHAYYASKYGKPIVCNNSENVICYDQHRLTKSPTVKHIKAINLSAMQSMTHNTNIPLQEIISNYV